MRSGFLPVPGRVAFSIFGIDIMWYALCVTAGMVIGSAIAYYRAPSKGLRRDDILDCLIYSLAAGVAGARIYYVIFQWEYYSGNLAKIFALREGGLAIHGGLIFGIGTCFLICLLKKIDFLEVIDICAPSIALGQAIGRWGNYFNSEAHGTVTDLPWAIEVDGQLVHPTSCTNPYGAC